VEKLSTNLSSIRPVNAPETRGPASRPDKAGGAEFREQLSKVPGTFSGSQSVTNLPQRDPEKVPGTLKFSNHAVDRMQSRGIRFTPEEMGKIQGAVAKAASKGSKESLLITDNAAMIVSIKDNTVVTVMDKASLKDNVFTNIDSTVMI
jgi:flagellar operon protein